jgi:hypothetical protein
LPEGVQQKIAEPLDTVLGRGPSGLDSHSVEIAADEICTALDDYPMAKEAFCWWFVARYPIYTSVYFPGYYPPGLDEPAVSRLSELPGRAGGEPPPHRLIPRTR